MQTPKIVVNSVILFLAFSFILSGCGSAGASASGTPSDAAGDSGRPPAGEEKMLTSNLIRIAAPAVPADDRAELVRGNSAFAAALYRELRGADGNLFFSPYSISLALAMVYGGARGSTESQMAQALHFTLPQDRLHPAFNSLDQTIAAYEKAYQDPDTKDDWGFQLSIANSLWGQEGFPFLPAYLDLLAQNYGAGMYPADFEGDPQGSRQIINDWVKQQTKGKISDILPEKAINTLTRLVLANAIYFKAMWQDPFNTTATKNGPFALLDGTTVQVPMMTPGGPIRIPYAQGNGCQALGLPYVGGNVMMAVLLPDPGGFAEFESSLTDSQLESILESILSPANRQSVVLTMPKFAIESGFDLNDTLKSLGMTDAFGKADFSGVDGQKDLVLSDVIHKAMVKVDELGTEAAAATVAVESLLAGPTRPIEVKIDRPFLFLIYDSQTHAILFLGRMVNPAS